MNQNRIRGMASYLLGSMQMKTGQLIGDQQLESRGAGNRIVGSSQRRIGEAQEIIKTCIRRQRRSS